MENFGWLELVFFYGIALSFGVYQYVKSDRALKKLRAEREEREALEGVKAAEAGAASAPGNPTAESEKTTN